MFFRKNISVFDEALNRINFIYDNCDDVIVSMSGGKDSTIAFNLTMQVARERGRLPLKVFWLDQEAEWEGTVDYMTEIMTNPDVEPLWFQIPFEFTNSLSHKENFLSVWDESCPEKWIHPKHELSIKENPSPYTRFHDLVKHLPTYCSNAEHCGVIVGMRADESLARRTVIANTKSSYKGITWSNVPLKQCRVFHPIYDFTFSDVWTAIANNKWSYNRVYDYQYQKGVPSTKMRISALIHETAWHAIEFLQEFEPKTYNRFVARINGVSTYSHSFTYGNILPKELPFAFKDWEEYRNYLLEHIVKDEYHDLFMRRWKKQNDEEWYKVHCKELVLNDIDGTINHNYSIARDTTNKRLKKESGVTQSDK